MFQIYIYLNIKLYLNQFYEFFSQIYRRGAQVAAGLTLASIFQTEGRYLDLPVNSRITYDRALREIGSNMIFGAYAAERFKPFKTSDSSCDNDNVLKQLFNEYQGKFRYETVLLTCGIPIIKRSRRKQ